MYRTAGPRRIKGLAAGSRSGFPRGLVHCRVCRSAADGTWHCRFQRVWCCAAVGGLTHLRGKCCCAGISRECRSGCDPMSRITQDNGSVWNGETLNVTAAMLRGRSFRGEVPPGTFPYNPKRILQRSLSYRPENRIHASFAGKRRKAHNNRESDSSGPR